MFLKKQNGRNGNGTTKGAQTCATPGCENTAQPSGYCFPCELDRYTRKCKTDGCMNYAHPDSGYCIVCESKWIRFALRAQNSIGARR